MTGLANPDKTPEQLVAERMVKAEAEVVRLRQECDDWNVRAEKALVAFETAVAVVERLREALQRIADGEAGLTGEHVRDERGT